MKHTLKLFAALALLLALALSLPVVAEDAVVEEAISNAADEAVELVPEVDLFDSEILMPEEVPEVSAPEVTTAPAEANGAAVKAQPKAASAIPSKLTLGVKETYKIDTTGLKGKITYKSSKTKIATVSKKGVIKAKKAGKAKITITPKKGKKKTVTVTVKKAPSKVTLDANNLNLEVGDTQWLLATLPAKTASNKFTWTSSKPGVVKITATDGEFCEFKALKAGTSVITVKAFNGKKATCKVTVKATPKPTATPTPTPKPTATPAPVKLSINKKSVSLEEGESVTVKVTYTGDDSIYWKTNDSDVATGVWEDGWDGDTCELTIKGWEAGSATIIVYNEANDKSASINVTVTAKRGYTGDIFGAWDTDVSAFSSALDDPLLYWDYQSSSNEDIYINNYMMVYASHDTDLITKMSLTNPSGGKYTLCKVYPGMGLATAKATALDYGWSTFFDKGDNYYYKASINGQMIYLVITKASDSSNVAKVYLTIP